MKLESNIMERILAAFFRTSALVLHVLALSPSIGALNCYDCQSEASCNTPQQRECDSQFDACVLQTSWIGELYMTMNMSRYCGFASECPRLSRDKTPFCKQTGDILTCTMCCDGDYCNNGGSGELLRPPPYPPIPEPLVKRLASNVCSADSDAPSPSCATSMSWSEESSVVNVLAVCGDGETSNEVPYSPVVVEEQVPCVKSGQYDTGICVTCCPDGVCAKAANSLSAIPILLVVCLSLIFVVSS